MKQNCVVGYDRAALARVLVESKELRALSHLKVSYEAVKEHFEKLGFRVVKRYGHGTGCACKHSSEIECPLRKTWISFYW
jgi:crotonobetainyl-CoA:carnitine CoA-transferase CaiB-like acyl-CoA transferase